MGKKDGKPWSFGLLGGKNGGKSILAFFILLVVAIMTHIAGAVSYEIKDRRERPALALKSFLRDVREFIRTEKKMPSSIRELEIKRWNKNDATIPTRLHGDNIFVLDYYEYIYFTGLVKGQPQINIWAIPLGKYRDEYNTVLLIIRNDGETTWSGPALDDEQRRSILENGFNPSVERMAQLYMKLDEQQKQNQGKKKFGFF